MSDTCKTCKFWCEERLEGSGISVPNGNTEWKYPIGKCGNTTSVHGGWNLGGKIGKASDMPSWGYCCLYKKKRAKSIKRNKK